MALSSSGLVAGNAALFLAHVARKLTEAAKNKTQDIEEQSREEPEASGKKGGSESLKNVLRECPASGGDISCRVKIKATPDTGQ